MSYERFEVMRLPESGFDGRARWYVQRRGRPSVSAATQPRFRSRLSESLPVNRPEHPLGSLAYMSRARIQSQQRARARKIGDHLGRGARSAPLTARSRPMAAPANATVLSGVATDVPVP